MKNSVFFWAWNSKPAQHDRLMTRERMARLMRAWRNQVRKPANSRDIVAFDRIGDNAYFVKSKHGETATIQIFATQKGQA